jgi:hypothetical protein
MLFWNCGLIEGDGGFYAPGAICETKAWRQIHAVTVLGTVEAATRKMKYGTVTCDVNSVRGGGGD